MARIQVLSDMKVGEYEMTDIDKLHPYPQNTKQHGKMQVSRIAASIRNYGYDVPIVVDEDFMILKGHGRWLAMQQLGRKQVPVIQRLHLSEAEKKALIISDNKLGESEWDPKALINEILDLESDFTIQDLGFSAKDLGKALPEDLLGGLSDILPEKTQSEIRESQREQDLHDAEGNRNPYYFESSMVERLEDESLYDLSLDEFAEYHDEVIVGFSSGKDSMAAAIWCFERLPQEKVKVLFGNPGWRVEWPHTIAYVDYANEYFKEKYGWEDKIVIAGSNDITRVKELFLQKGFPIPHMCFIQSEIKIRALEAKETEMGWRDGTKKRMRIIAIRWEESSGRYHEYPERAKLKGSPFNFCSPIISWTGMDTAKYVWDHGAVLNPLYQFSPRAGCMMCPSSHPSDIFWMKENYPQSYKIVMEWAALSARKKGFFSEIINRFLVLPDEIPAGKMEEVSPYKQYSMTDEVLLEHLRRIRGEDIPDNYFV
jgi:3'-phosphoadenosine 5'-phosphosulfate sulfotransferase (PAPS reductase)/FAD synthetase